MKQLIEKVFDSLEKQNVFHYECFSMIPDGFKPFLVAYLWQKAGCSLLFLVENNQKAEMMEQNLNDMGFPASSLLFYDTLPYEDTNPTPILVQKRLKTLIEITENKNQIYCIPLKSFLFPSIEARDLRDSFFSITKNQKIHRQQLIQFLSDADYQRMPRVEKKGDFAVRGEVIDIFPYYLDNPIRIDFFDNQVEQIRSFSIEDQMTNQYQQKWENIKIYPLYEKKLNSKEIENLLQSLQSTYPLSLLSSFREFLSNNPTQYHFIPLLYGAKNRNILDFFQENNHPFLMVSERQDFLEEEEKGIVRETKEMFYSSFNINKLKATPKEYFLDLKSCLAKTIFKKMVGLSSSESSCLSLPIRPAPYYRGRLELFRSHTKEWQDYTIGIGCSYEGQLERMKEILPECHCFLSYSLETGFIDSVSKTVFLTESDLFGKRYLTSRRKLILSSSPIDSFSDIERGDYVIHVNHGIGRYDGIEKITVLGKQKDYIKVLYADESTLYVPIEQIFLLHKYLCAEDNPPQLDKLGGKNWEKRKERVEKKMREMARELALLYGKRQTLKGFKYPPDNQWQYEFEAGFPYEETPDQLKAVEDIKRDMESDKPMDRLICGDVGYGKTEVAMRACFKAVCAGKQVAVLTPTTLLAEQHYQSFLERFQNFSVSIRMLSRLVSASETNKILKQLKEGQIDILIGTHKILSDNVVFKDLGLLVIDEEQRFGVKHKEKIKQLKSSIDVLTLSATPIPRTLYMGLSELRDMSLITTPPVSRMPVKTYVMPFNENVLKQAITRELDRQGQVFIIHNRVKTIYQFADYVQRLVPSARIGVGHGQLSASEIEDVFLEFIHGQKDILVSTTIVENGIDIPNANTIIIDRPEYLGLSELYQLRGRVGRSNKQGYAYLFYDPAQGLSGDVEKRLLAIEEYTDLGSGFKIAMKDLEIRGAGNLLGGEQSGFIADVGLELYAKMMQKAVAEVKGNIVEEEIEPVLDILFHGYIPENYIYEEKERFSLYKIIMRAKEIEEVDQIAIQVRDRYGRIPENAHNLFWAAKIKILCRKAGIIELKESKDFFEFRRLENNHNIRVEVIVDLIKKQQGKINGPVFYLFKNTISEENKIEFLFHFLSLLIKK